MFHYFIIGVWLLYLFLPNYHRYPTEGTVLCGISLTVVVAYQCCKHVVVRFRTKDQGCVSGVLYVVNVLLAVMCLLMISAFVHLSLTKGIMVQ